MTDTQCQKYQKQKIAESIYSKSGYSITYKLNNSVLHIMARLTPPEPQGQSR